ncbi:MAG: NAD+ synthase [bacterium]
MYKENLRIALSQINTTVGGIKSNVAKIIRQIGCARDMQADIVTFPELAISGYPPEDLLLRPRFLRDCKDALYGTLPECAGMTVILGFPDAIDGHVYNAAALINHTKWIDTYHKVELPNYGVFDERRYFCPGEGALFFDIRGISFMITICEDIWIKNGAVERSAIEKHANVVLNISSSPFYAGKLGVRQRIISHFAKKTGSFVSYTNLVGGQDELVFDGGSMIVGPGGEELSSARRFEEDLLIFDIETDRSPDHISPPLMTDPKIKYYVFQPNDSGDRNPVPLGETRKLERLEEIYEALVLGTRDYVHKNGFKKVIIGLSGGMDSALTCVLAVDALGNENVIAVTMPSEYTSMETLTDSKLVAENLQVSFLNIPIKGMYSAYCESLKGPFGKGEPGIEYENIQARIRGNILMALSNRFGWLVLTTGNKSEMAVGYCTLYGDMAGGFAVIKDLPKTTVYELAQYMNMKKDREIIPNSIFERPPTAELKPDQKDEDLLPPYPLLDQVLRAYVEEDKSPDEIIKSGFDMEMVNKVIYMVDKTEYKRRQAPPGIKITPKAFGKDRRLPITNHYSHR